MRRLAKSIFVALCLVGILSFSGCAGFLAEADNLHLITASPEQARQIEQILNTEELCDGPALFAGAKRKSGKLVIQIRCESSAETGE